MCCFGKHHFFNAVWQTHFSRKMISCVENWLKQKYDCFMNALSKLFCYVILCKISLSQSSKKMVLCRKKGIVSWSRGTFHEINLIREGWNFLAGMNIFQELKSTIEEKNNWKESKLMERHCFTPSGPWVSNELRINSCHLSRGANWERLLHSALRE